MSIIKEGTTKDGIVYIIRHPEMGDVESGWKFVNRISQERTFVSFQGEEIFLEDEKSFIESRIKLIEEGKGTALFLVVDGEVQGVSGVETKLRSESHVGVFGLMIDASVRGQGLGSELTEAVLEDISRIEGLQIVVLTVKSPNDVARALYKKLGFEEFGMLPEGTKHQDEFVDEIYMYKKIV